MFCLITVFILQILIFGFTGVHNFAGVAAFSALNGIAYGKFEPRYPLLSLLHSAKRSILISHEPPSPHFPRLMLNYLLSHALRLINCAGCYVTVVSSASLSEVSHLYLELGN